MERSQSAITAYHEAGHAVLAMANGFRVSEIASSSDEFGHGHVIYSYPKNPSYMDRLRIVIIAAAGAAADFCNWDAEMTRQGGVSTGDECIRGIGSDVASAHRQLSEIGDPGSFEDYVGVAMAFLKRPEIWHWVELFGESMQKIQLLNGQVVLERAFNQVPKISEAEVLFWREQVVINRVLDRRPVRTP